MKKRRFCVFSSSPCYSVKCPVCGVVIVVHDLLEPAVYVQCRNVSACSLRKSTAYTTQTRR